MSAKENFLHKLSIGLVVSGLMAISAVWVAGQTSSEIKVGRAPAEAPTAYVDDWSHHHLVFSNPGTEADALAQGRYEEWLKITNNPRYQLQQLKRGTPTRPVAPAVSATPQDFASRVAAATVPGDFATRIGVALARPTPTPEPIGLPARRPTNLGQPIKKDWSQTLNPLYSTGTITTNNASGSPLSSVTINGTALNASPPTAATQSGSVGSLPTTTSTNGITVTNTSPANTFTLTTNASAANGYKANFAGPILGATTISFTSGGNTINASPAGAGAYYTGTVTNTAPTTSTTVKVTSGSNALVLTATKGTGGSTATGDIDWGSTTNIANGDTITIGATVYLFESSTGSCGATDRCVDRTGSRTTQVTALVNAISGTCYVTCPGGAVNDPSVTAANDASNDVFLYNITTAGVTLSGTSSSSGNWTFNGVTGGTSETVAQNVTNSCSTSLVGTFIQTPFTASSATYLANAINACNTGFAAVAATSSVNGSIVTITDAFPGASVNTFTVLNGGTNNLIASWTSNAGTTGSASCSGSSGTYTVAFVNSSTAATVASNFNSALNLSGCPASGGFTSSYTSANTFATVSDTILGAATFTPATATNFSWTVGTAGSNGSNVCTSATTADYATSTTTGGVANNISAAINACTAYIATIGLNNNSSPSGTSVAVNAYTPGSTGGNTVTLGPTSGGIFNWTASTLSGGGDGTQSGTTWTYWLGNAAVSTTQLATNIASTINNSSVAAVVTAQAIGATVVVSSDTGTAYAVSATNFSGIAWSPATTSAFAQSAVQPNALPAVYGQSLTSASCSNDWVAYPTGLTGSSTAASIIAYSNIYSSCSGTVPTQYWAINSGGAVTTSPILSLDGTQMAYIQSSGTAATLVLINWATGGTLNAPITPTNQTSGANYNNCTPSANTPCMYLIPFGNGANDTFSSPFYDNVNDTIYVGDDSGKLHQFTNVFLGSPAENTTSPWPVSLGSAKVSSPVYDFKSGYVFVGDFAGTLRSVVASTGAINGNTGTMGDAIADGPLVDSTVNSVTAFVTTSSTTAFPGDNVAFEFSTGFTVYGTPGAEYAGVGGAGYYLYDGAFDNVYFTSGGTGYLYVVGDTGGAGTSTGTGANLYQIGLSNGFFNGVDNAAVSNLSFTGTGGTHGWPSPASEFCNNGSSACALNPQRTVTGSLKATSAEVNLTAGTFTNADIGSVLTGTGIPANDTISAVLSGTTANLTTAPSVHAGETLTVIGGNSTTSGTDYVFFSVSRGNVGGCTTTAGNGCVLSYNVSSPGAVAISGTGLKTVTSGTNGCWATAGIVIDNSSTTTGASQMYFVNFNGVAAGGPTAGTKTSSNCTSSATTGIIDAVQTSQANP